MIKQDIVLEFWLKNPDIVKSLNIVSQFFSKTFFWFFQAV